MIVRAPKIAGLAVNLHIDLMEMPHPMAKSLHATDPLAAEVSGEQRVKAIPPHPPRLVPNVDTSLKREILDGPQAQRNRDIHEHHQEDHLG